MLIPGFPKYSQPSCVVGIIIPIPTLILSEETKVQRGEVKCLMTQIMKDSMVAYCISFDWFSVLLLSILTDGESRTFLRSHGK